MSESQTDQEKTAQERMREFYEEEEVNGVVDAIVSVVSGTLTEGIGEIPHGASLYYDGITFQHSLGCQCLLCSICESRLSRLTMQNENLPFNVPEDRTCTTCGMYESYSVRMLESELIETADWPTRHLCVGCYEAENQCLSCGQPLIWGVPCECSSEAWFIDREGDTTYIEEYENEELPENNTEKVKKVKESVKNMGELVFNLQEKLSEGEYLELMNHLQKITNEVNNLD